MKLRQSPWVDAVEAMNVRGRGVDYTRTFPSPELNYLKPLLLALDKSFLELCTFHVLVIKIRVENVEENMTERVLDKKWIVGEISAEFNKMKLSWLGAI